MTSKRVAGRAQRPETIADEPLKARRNAMIVAVLSPLVGGVFVLGSAMLDRFVPQGLTKDTVTTCTSANANVKQNLDLGIRTPEMLERINPEDVDTQCGEEVDIAREIGGNLRGAELDGADLQGFQLSGKDLSLASMRGVDLSDSNLQNARLQGSRLNASSLKRADLRRADLRGAILTGADLSGACLDGADLRGADLTGAETQEAHAKGAIFASPSEAQASGLVVGTNATSCPSGGP